MTSIVAVENGGKAQRSELRHVETATNNNYMCIRTKVHF